jgi:hypothetical protein
MVDFLFIWAYPELSSCLIIRLRMMVTMITAGIEMMITAGIETMITAGIEMMITAGIEMMNTVIGMEMIEQFLQTAERSGAA